MQRMWSSSHIAGGNAAYVEDMYERYLRDPNSVEVQWRDYFEKLPPVSGGGADVPHSTIQENFILMARQRQTTRPIQTSSVSSDHERKQVQVLRLISAFRIRGHQKAVIDPLGVMKREEFPDLSLSYHGLSEADLDTEFQTSTLFIGKEHASLREIFDALKATYCESMVLSICTFPDRRASLVPESYGKCSQSSGSGGRSQTSLAGAIDRCGRS